MNIWKNRRGEKLAAIGLMAIALLVMGAAGIRWYNDAAIPQKTTLNGAEIIALQQTGPNAWRWALMSDVRAYMGGGVGGPVTVINVTTNYTTNAFITFLTVQSNAYFLETNFVHYEIVTNLTVVQMTVESNTVNVQFVTNQYVTFNQTVYQTNFNNYSFVTNQTILQTNFANYSITTNLTVENIVNIKGNATFHSNIFITNGIAIGTNLWSGPTNTLNALVADQYYDTFTPVSVTGIVNALPGVSHSVQLTIFNRAATNVTMTLDSGIVQDNGATGEVTVTNGTERVFWIKLRTGVKTNTISQTWVRT